VHSGEAALGHLTKTSYDLLVADIRMPRDGRDSVSGAGRPRLSGDLGSDNFNTGDTVNSVTRHFL